ncbi:glycosyltransferase [Candidatus Aminicenantes bacterium AC-335-A11]|nr:glycosyltransferase [SCandidatus Aminicenantes bacterium Aminicenantia_JdfR_composite]MCP2596403.1 glycosyltransferase [Candidatus Aminicenantes bacterium AC-335-G13]MCP2618219.1 glycosyltransferase [Candidatus Aminicenantes bacterium AC-335-A11]
MTKNSLNVVNNLVDALLSQNFKYNFEIIFMDNNSKDGTLKYLENVKKSAQNFEVRIVHVPEGEFSHSRTRMKAANLAKGKFIVFFTDDVVPIGKDFLEKLTQPVREGKVAASYGVFQIGGKLYDPIDAYIHNNWYHEYEEISEPISTYCWNKLSPLMRRKLSNFDNCASCINKEILLKIKLPDVPYGEDMTFAKRLILNNYRVALVKDAKFYHWHKVKFGYILKRMCIDQDLSIREFDLYYVSHLLGVVKNILIRIIHRTYIGLFKIKAPIWKKIYWIFYNIKILIADFLGKYIGTLDEERTKGFLSPIKKKLLKIKHDIINEIYSKSLLRY